MTDLFSPPTTTITHTYTISQRFCGFNAVVSVELTADEYRSQVVTGAEHDKVIAARAELNKALDEAAAFNRKFVVAESDRSQIVITLRVNDIVADEMLAYADTLFKLLAYLFPDEAVRTPMFYGAARCIPDTLENRQILANAGIDVK